MGKIPFGLCGVPCGLCPMYHISGESRCTGCRQDEHSYSVSCNIFKCGRQKGISSCGLCAEYPCSKSEKLTEFDGFDTEKIWIRTCDAIAHNGEDAWYIEYEKKCNLLADALDAYNDGRSKRYLCRLFMQNDLPLLKEIMGQAKQIDQPDKKLAAKQFKEIVKRIMPE